MDLQLVGRILAVVWIAISLWMLWVNILILSILLMGIGERGGRPLSIRNEASVVVFFATAATAVGTSAFASPKDIPANVGYVLLTLAMFALFMLAGRVVVRRRDR